MNLTAGGSCDDWYPDDADSCDDEVEHDERMPESDADDRIGSDNSLVCKICFRRRRSHDVPSIRTEERDVPLIWETSSLLTNKMTKQQKGEKVVSRQTLQNASLVHGQMALPLLHPLLTRFLQVLRLCGFAVQFLTQ